MSNLIVTPPKATVSVALDTETWQDRAKALNAAAWTLAREMSGGGVAIDSSTPAGKACEAMLEMAVHLGKAGGEIYAVSERLLAAEELARGLLGLVTEFHAFCDDKKRPCGDPDAECPIGMGEWVSASDREFVARAREELGPKGSAI